MRAVLAAMMLCLFVLPASAHGRGHGHGVRHWHHPVQNEFSHGQNDQPWEWNTPQTHEAVSHFDARPLEWCGWWLRHELGVADRAFNLSRNWARWGSASGPQVGAVVVWPHHVGIITGHGPNGEWVVKSGNDGHAVRERPRSLAGAIAFRQG